MATRQSTVEMIVARAGGAGQVSARRMFGAYGLYRDGRLVALVCDDRLFLKPTAEGRARLGTVTEAPPYPGAKPHLLVPEALWDDADRLFELIRLTAASLPMPAAKTPKPGPGRRAR